MNPTSPHNPRVMMGFTTPADGRVSITIRDWNALKLALWRSMTGWEIAVRAALEIVERCRHEDGCPGKDLESEPCTPGCPDREQRMSALVILNAARMYVPVRARPANDPYMAPSREYFSEVMSSFAVAQAELEAMREKYKVEPLPNEERVLPSPTPLRVPAELEEENP